LDGAAELRHGAFPFSAAFHSHFVVPLFLLLAMILPLFAAAFLVFAQAQTPSAPAAPSSAAPAATAAAPSSAATSTTTPAAADPAVTPPQSFIQSLGGLPILVFMTIIFYFVILRPQQKRAREAKELVAALKSGDRVITSSGIYGLIANVTDRTVMVKIAEGVKVEMDRSSIATVLNRANDGKVEVLPAAK
jgi:preprotein translocase subunit YajC